MAKKRKPKARRARKTYRSRRPKQARGTVRRAIPKAYPSPAERERIIARRDKLLQELISIFVETGSSGKPPEGLARLAEEYGLDEVHLVLDKFQQTATSRELIGEEATLYRIYRQAFARFGGNRPFLNKRDYEELIFEHGKLVAFRQLKSFVPVLPRRSAREKELYALLLVGVDYWEDITPPAVPPRPADFDAPPPETYDDPARALLEWGWEDDERRLADSAKNAAKWRPAIPDLMRMVFDEGLLEGWPGETTSWAPYHALHLLGYLGAHEYAGTLLVLMDRENDWLSDRLPVVWEKMGPSAEPPLWAYLSDRSHDPEKRAIILMGLKRMAEAHPERRPDIIDRMANLLRRAPADDATANGYIVHILDRMQAVETHDIIFEAFEQDKVDPKIIQPYDVNFVRD